MAGTRAITVLVLCTVSVTPAASQRATDSALLPQPALAASFSPQQETAPGLAVRHRVSPTATNQKRRHLRLMLLGFATSIAAHELAHVTASLAGGGKPTIGFDAGRPVAYSGIDPAKDPDKQLLFSSAGLVVQIVMDELLLDIPRGQSGSFEHGILAGGITTGLFYALIGRNSSVSDVTNIAESSGLTKGQVGLILGSISALHAVRVMRDVRFAHFFAAPGAEGQLKVGVLINGH